MVDINPFYKPGAITPTPVATEDDLSNRDIRVLVEAHDAFRLTREKALTVAREVEAAASQWREVAQRFGIDPEALQPMEPAFEGANRQRALALAPTTPESPERARPVGV